ncbi:MAG: hypothetical protein ACI8S6_001061 [Myxococcota bacterium]|jgi:hypothetical protein
MAPLLLISLALSIAWLAREHADRTPAGPRWLGGVAMVAVVLGMIAIWGAQGADAASLSILYSHGLVPGFLTLAASAAMPAVMTQGRAAVAARLLVAGALVAAAGVRLDARLLQLVLLADEPLARGWLAERLATTWAWRGHLDLAAAMLVAAAVACLQPRGRSLLVLGACGAMLVAASVSMNAAWGTLRPPAAVARLAEQALPVLEAPGVGAVSVEDLVVGRLLAAAPGQRVRQTELDGVEAILVLLPGTEQLPAELRWAGWRTVALDLEATSDQRRVFGSAGQVWMQASDGIRALGPIGLAPQRLGVARGPVTVRPGGDWQVGDVAALCAHDGCTLETVEVEGTALTQTW